MKAKNLLHYLLVALLAVMMITVFAISVSAAEPAETDYFEVLDTSNAHVGYYETHDTAMAAMQAGYTLKLLRDYTATTPLVLDLDAAYSIDATGATMTFTIEGGAGAVTGVIQHSAGTVTVKGGTFCTDSGVLWAMTGSAAGLTVENGTFRNTTVANTTANSSIAALFRCQKMTATINIDNATLASDGTIFFLADGAADALTSVDLTLGTGVTASTRKFVIYSQALAKGDITIQGGNYTGGRILHICGGSAADATGTITISGNGNYHSLYVATAASMDETYKANCLVQNTNDVGGVYVGRKYNLTITGGNFTFDGPGVFFQNSTGKLEITGGSFKTTRTNSDDLQQIMLFLMNAPNADNIVRNASFESYGGTKTTTARGVVAIGDNSALYFGEGFSVFAHGGVHAIHVYGLGPHTLTFAGGIAKSETGAAYQDSGHDQLGEGNTMPITFCGTTFESGRMSDGGVLEIHGGAQYLINGGTYRHSAVDPTKTTANVLFNVYGTAGVTIKKGTFVCGNFLRMGGKSATADKSAVVLIDPAQDEDVIVSGGAGTNAMMWYQGNTGYYPTLIIKGGIFTHNGSGYILAGNNGCKGNAYIFGGQYSAPNKSIFGVWTWNEYNLHIYGGTYEAKERFLNLEMTASAGASILHSVELYGNQQATITWPTLNDYGNAVLVEAGLKQTAADTTYTFTAGGVKASNMISIYTNSTTATTTKGTISFYGGEYTIEAGNTQNLFTDGTAAEYEIINFYGGTFHRKDTVSRMFKIVGGNTWNFYGGTFINDVGCSDIIATATGCRGAFNFYGAGTYNGIATEGVTMIHKGGATGQSFFESDNATTETLTVYGGTFISEFAHNALFTIRHTGEVQFLGGTFTAESRFLYLADNANATIGDIYFTTAAGLSAILENVSANNLTISATTGTLTYFAGSNEERTITWKEYADGVNEDLSGLLDIADENGEALGMSDMIGTFEDALAYATETGAIVLLGDIRLTSPLILSQDITIFGNGFSISSANNFGDAALIQIAENVTVRFVNVTFHDEYILSATSCNVILDACTVQVGGNITAAIKLSGTADVSLVGTALIAPTGIMPSDTQMYGLYFLLQPGFTGNVSLDAACTVTGGTKLIYAQNIGDSGAKGSVTVTGVAIGVNQFVMYSQALCNTSLTLTDCSFTGNRIMHVCAATATTVQPGAEYVVEGGNYTTYFEAIYVGNYRHGNLRVLNSTITGENQTNSVPVFSLRYMDTVLFDGGVYTCHSDTPLLFPYYCGTVTVKNATLTSTASGVNNDAFVKNQQAGVYIGTNTEATLENLTVSASNTPAIYIDGGGHITVNSGSYLSEKYVVAICSGNVENLLNIKGGSFETKEGVYSYAVQWYGGITNIYGGTFRASSNTDTLITAEGSAATCTINIFGGYFESDGMCVARVLGGKTGSEANGVVTTASHCELNIEGGMFVLAPNPGRNSVADGVIRCGGGTTYGTVNISGGTFINQHGDEKNKSYTVINKNNAASSISVTGGTFVMIDGTANQEYFYHVNQGFIDSTGAVENKPTYNVTVFGNEYDGSTHISVDDVAHATFAMNGKTYFAYGALAGEFSALEKGAQVRIRTASNGIRFVSTFSAEMLATIREAASAAGVEAEFGTVITTTSNIFEKAGGAFTIEALGGMEQNNINFVNIPAVNGITNNEDGSMEIRAALVNIKEENYNRSFSAISYAKVGDTYYYSNFNLGDNSRTVAQVAEAALADTTGTLPCYDNTGAPTGESTSKYTKSQQEILYRYLGYTWVVA